MAPTLSMFTWTALIRLVTSNYIIIYIDLRCLHELRVENSIHMTTYMLQSTVTLSTHVRVSLQ